MEYTTRNGICNNLKMSPYTAQLEGITYHFSSIRHKDAFMARYEANRKKINDSLSKRFKVDICCSSLADLVLYRQVEGRGFYVSIMGEGIGMEWQDTIRYDGGMLTRNGSEET